MDGVELIYKEELKDVEEDLLKAVKTEFVCSIESPEWLSEIKNAHVSPITYHVHRCVVNF